MSPIPTTTTTNAGSDLHFFPIPGHMPKPFYDAVAPASATTYPLLAAIDNVINDIHRELGLLHAALAPILGPAGDPTGFSSESDTDGTKLAEMEDRLRYLSGRIQDITNRVRL